MPEILRLNRRMWENFCELEAILGYRVRHFLKNQTKWREKAVTLSTVFHELWPSFHKSTLTSLL